MVLIIIKRMEDKMLHHCIIQNIIKKHKNYLFTNNYKETERKNTKILCKPRYFLMKIIIMINANIKRLSKGAS